MLHYSDREDTGRHLNIIWDALYGIPIKSDPEKDIRNAEISDNQWLDICTAMAWITEDLDITTEINHG